MLRHIMMLGVLLTLTGCAHAQFDHWKNDEYTICCNAFCGEEDWTNATARSCTKDSKMIGGGLQTVGYNTQVYNNDSAYPLTSTTPEKQKCRIYKCGGEVTPW